MKEYYHAWNSVFFGAVNPFDKLIKYHSELKNAWTKLTEKDLRNLKIHEIYIKNFINLKKTGAPFKEFEKLKSQNIKIITIRDEIYPPQLHELNKDFSPKILYLKGNIPTIQRHYIAIVGTRDMTDYGQIITKKLVQVLNSNDFVVVSGLARGIDTTAHKAAVDNRIPTIAVLGFGINKIPYYQSEIADKIIQNGAIISEYPPNLMAQKFHFPMRNRIISGLSKSIVVIEGGEKSGALITAKRAADQGRDVFAIPGRITDETSKGPHIIINEGATPLFKVEDIYTHIGIKQTKLPLIINQYSNEMRLIIESLKQKNLSKNELIQKIPMPVSKLSVNLTELELENVIEKNRSGKYFIK